MLKVIARLAEISAKEIEKLNHKQASEMKAQFRDAYYWRNEAWLIFRKACPNYSDQEVLANIKEMSVRTGTLDEDFKKFTKEFSFFGTEFISKVRRMDSELYNLADTAAYFVKYEDLREALEHKSELLDKHLVQLESELNNDHHYAMD